MVKALEFIVEKTSVLFLSLYDTSNKAKSPNDMFPYVKAFEAKWSLLPEHNSEKQMLVTSILYNFFDITTLRSDWQTLK
jgi:hypothetical protein